MIWLTSLMFVGKEQGIMLILLVSSSSALYDKIVASADGIPGSSELPNITTGYPKSAIILMNNDKLADLKEYFSQDELDQYLPRFIEEGIINDKWLFSYSQINRSPFP